MIPSQFDVALEAGWRSQPVDPSAWMQAWSSRRYGTPGGVPSPSLSAATSELVAGAYGCRSPRHLYGGAEGVHLE